MAEFNLTVPGFLLDYRSVTLYQEWLNLGNEGTMADFIAWLRTPATEAAAQALQATAEALAAAQTLGQGIAAAEAAATLANTKAVLANDAALLANEKAALVDSAATLASTKAGLANDAAVLATEKAALADSKATLANEKAALAQLAADNASLGGAVINLEPGQYLSDVVQTITGATLENPVTINFYNHSKTVNWETFTEKIHWPEHVHLNFVGNINWWPGTYFPRMAFYEGLLSSNPTDKLFLGFSFDRTNDDSVIKVSGLPENVQKAFFGGLDESYQIAESYQNLIDTPEDWGEAEFGLVRVNGSKGDDARNDALYKKIDGVFIDVTPDFRYVDFSGCDLKLAYFSSANNQGANFTSANNMGANFTSANNQLVSFDYANNMGANFYSANNQGAQFYYANNQGANFYSANNHGAEFYYANNMGANFDSANNQGANFYSASNQGAYFGYANLKDVNWDNVISIENANFQNADLTGGVNLPERINTKAKWVAECGAGNVNTETIWIDGTSILS